MMVVSEPDEQQQAWGYWACRFDPVPTSVACAWKPFASPGKCSASHGVDLDFLELLVTDLRL
jgi:hypothetical protein